MKLTKFKVFAASTALTVSLLSGCYAKIEIIRQPQHKERIEKSELIKKYDGLIGMAKRYDNLILGEDYAEGRIIVSFDEGTTREEADKFIESHDSSNELEMLSYSSEMSWGIVNVPKGKEQAYALFFQNMSDETIMDFADLDYIIRTNIIIPKIGNQN